MIVAFDQLEDEWQTSLNGEYPPDPSPWGTEQFANFYTRARTVLRDVQKELGADYSIVDEIEY